MTATPATETELALLAIQRLTTDSLTATRLDASPQKGYVDNLVTVRVQCLPSCAARLNFTYCNSYNLG